MNSASIHNIRKEYLRRFLTLMLGFIVIPVGISLTINANIGYSPWEILHSGISKVSGMGIGRASIVAGLLIGCTVWIRGEKFGIGTILNMVVIGTLVDLYLSSGLIPLATDLFQGIVMLLVGLFIISIGVYLYLSPGFGAGPRDSLMAMLTRMIPLPIGVIRSAMEFTAAFIGWLMGGMVGIGSIISVVAIGFFFQQTFRFFKFKPEEVEHETLQETLATLRRLLRE